MEYHPIKLELMQVEIIKISGGLAPLVGPLESISQPRKLKNPHIPLNITSTIIHLSTNSPQEYLIEKYYSNANSECYSL